MPFNEKGEFIRTDLNSAEVGGISREDWVAIVKGLGALVLLAGVIWVVLVFRQWIVILIVIWLASRLKRLFRSIKSFLDL